MVTPASPRRRARLTLFFGAGAEASDGLPTGGRFALEVIRRAKDPIDAFKADRVRINGGCTMAYRKWLPVDLMKQRVAHFGKSERSRIFEDSLRGGYARVVASLDAYDASATAFMGKHGVARSRVEALFREASAGATLGAERYAHVAVSDSITRDPSSLFASEFFSAILTLAKARGPHDEMTRLARATMQFYLGAHGQGAMHAMSDNPLKNAPDDNPAFAELGRLFDVNPVDAGVAAFEAVMDHQEGGPVDATAPRLFQILAVSVLEAAVEQFLDYRAMLDELLPSLYRPRDSWAKFTKVSLFLRATRDYVVQQQNAARGVTDGYYHDLAVALAARRFELVRVGSSNYTDLCHSAIRELHQEPVLALNGSLDLSLDPYKNEIVPASRSAQVARFLVPFLFTQSGVKPLTSVDVSRKYVAYYDAVKDSDAAVVAGFGFHGDDGHINALFRQAVDDDGKRLIVLQYASDGAFDVAAAREALGESLRVENTERITVLPVDQRRLVNGELWTDAVLNALS